MSENTVTHTHDSSSGMGFFLGIIALIIFFYLMIVYGLPYIRGASQPQINVPSDVNVNIKDQSK